MYFSTSYSINIIRQLISLPHTKMNAETCDYQATQVSVTRMIARHKNVLAHNFAFTLHKGLVAEVRDNVFMLPPRRVEEKDSTNASTAPPSETEDDNTSTIMPAPIIKSPLNETKPPDLVQQLGQQVISANENQNRLLNKVMPIISQYEDYLVSNKYAGEKDIRSVRLFNRGLVNYILTNQETFTNIPRESLALVTILLSAESFRFNKNLLLLFITSQLENARLTKISQIRKSRGYSLLSSVVRPQIAQTCL